MSLRKCSKCKKRLVLSVFNSKKNGNLNKMCRNCVEKQVKNRKRLRERHAKEASCEGRRCCSKCNKKLELSAFDSKKNGNIYKNCRNCLQKINKRNKRLRDQRTKENSANARPTKRLKRIVDDICDEVRARLNNTLAANVKQQEFTRLNNILVSDVVKQEPHK